MSSFSRKFLFLWDYFLSSILLIQMLSIELVKPNTYIFCKRTENALLIQSKMTFLKWSRVQKLSSPEVNFLSQSDPGYGEP